MDINRIVTATIKVFHECNVHSFPINCEELLIHYGYRLFTYRELQQKNSELYALCLDYSEDAFRSGTSKIVAYNTDRPEGRIRFSLMHELGHHVLEHIYPSDQNEKRPMHLPVTFWPQEWPYTTPDAKMRMTWPDYLICLLRPLTMPI